MTSAALRNSTKAFLLAFIATQLSVLLSAHSREGSEANHSTYRVYRVEAGDTLSGILYDKFKISPVYGASGYIRQAINLNSGNVLKQGDLIRVGDLILIPSSGPADNSLGFALEHLDENNQLRAQQAIAVAARDVDPAKTAFDSKASAASGNRSEGCDQPSRAPTGEIETRSTEQRPSQINVDTREAKSETVVEASRQLNNANQINTATDVDIRAPSSELYLGLGSSYLGVRGFQSSNNTRANLLSRLSPRLVVGWSQHWSEKFSTEFLFRFQRVEILDDLNGVTIENENIGKSGFGLSLRYRIFAPVEAFVEALVAEELFYRGSSSGAIVIQTVPTTQTSLGAKIALIDRKPLSLHAIFNYSILSAASYDDYLIRSGRAYQARLTVTHHFEKSKFACGLGARGRDQQTSLVEIQERELILDCAYGWSL